MTTAMKSVFYATGVALSLAQGPAMAQEAAPTSVTQNTTGFDNWIVACETAPKGEKRCIARVNVIKSAEDPRPLLFLLVVKNSKGREFYVQTPTSIQLKPGVQLTLGKNAGRNLEFINCEPALCTSQIPYDEALAKELTTSETATAIWMALAAGEVKVEFALKGAKDALAFLDKQ